MGRIRVRKQHPAIRQPLDIGRLVDAGCAVQCGVTPAKIIRQNEQDIRRIVSLRGGGRIQRNYCYDGQISKQWCVLSDDIDKNVRTGARPLSSRFSPGTTLIRGRASRGVPMLTLGMWAATGIVPNCHIPGKKTEA